MRVLIACEFSGTIRDKFSEKGHDAWSCDLLDSECQGNHYKGSVFSIIDDGWDLMIAHPPCTYLAVSGNRWLYNKDGTKNQKRWDKRWDALDFVWKLMKADIPKICIENPVSCISSEIRKPDQIIEPYMFGDEAQKATCLWLKGLPRLRATKIVGRGEFVYSKSGNKMPKWYNDAFNYSKQLRQKIRSKTFDGMAQAMADQWG